MLKRLIKPFLNNWVQLSEIEIRKREQRLTSLKNGIVAFEKSNGKVLTNISGKIKDNAADIINKYYWDELYPNLKRHVKPDKNGIRRLDRFKTIAGIEISILHNQPIVCKDVLIKREINTKLAYSIAIAMFNKIVLEDNHSIEKKQEKDLKRSEKGLEPNDELPNTRIPLKSLLEKRKSFYTEDYGFKVFKDKHLRWMMKLIKKPPYSITLNSHNWLLLYMYFCSVNNLDSNFKTNHNLDKRKIKFELLKI